MPLPKRLKPGIYHSKKKRLAADQYNVQTNTTDQPATKAASTKTVPISQQQEHFL